MTVLVASYIPITLTTRILDPLPRRTRVWMNVPRKIDQVKHWSTIHIIWNTGSQKRPSSATKSKLRQVFSTGGGWRVTQKTTIFNFNDSLRLKWNEVSRQAETRIIYSRNTIICSDYFTIICFQSFVSFFQGACSISQVNYKCMHTLLTRIWLQILRWDIYSLLNISYQKKVYRYDRSLYMFVRLACQMMIVCICHLIQPDTAVFAKQNMSSVCRHTWIVGRARMMLEAQPRASLAT